MASITYRLTVRWRWWFHLCLLCWRALSFVGIYPSAEGMEWYIRRALIKRLERCEP